MTLRTRLRIWVLAVVSLGAMLALVRYFFFPREPARFRPVSATAAFGTTKVCVETDRSAGKRVYHLISNLEFTFQNHAGRPVAIAPAGQVGHFLIRSRTDWGFTQMSISSEMTLEPWLGGGLTRTLGPNETLRLSRPFTGHISEGVILEIPMIVDGKPVPFRFRLVAPPVTSAVESGKR